MKVQFWKWNVFRNYDQPAWLYIDTEGETLRLRIYDRETSALLVDDTLTGTNRTGAFTIQIWRTTPTTTVGIHQIVVEAYDTSNRLKYVAYLDYLYANRGRRIWFKPPSGQLMGFHVDAVFIVNGKPFYWYDVRVSTNTEYYDIDPYPLTYNDAIFEVYAYPNETPDGLKYYWIGFRHSLPAGDTTVTVNGFSDYALVKFTFLVTPRLFSIILPGWMQFAQSVLLSLIPYAPMYMGQMIANAMGVKLDVVDARYYVGTDGNGYLEVYVMQDLAPFLVAAIILGVIGILLALVLTGTLKEAEVSYRTAAMYDKAVEMTRETENTKRMVLDLCSKTSDPVRCIDEVSKSMGLSQPNPATALASAAVAQAQQAQQWMWYTVAAGIVGLALGYILRPKGTTERA